MLTQDLLHRFRDADRNLLDGSFPATIEFGGRLFERVTATNAAGNVLFDVSRDFYNTLIAKGYVFEPVDPWSQA